MFAYGATGIVAVIVTLASQILSVCALRRLNSTDAFRASHIADLYAITDTGHYFGTVTLVALHSLSHTVITFSTG